LLIGLVVSLAYVKRLVYVWHKFDLGLFVNRAPGDEKIIRICINMLHVQPQPEACASDLGDSSHIMY